MIVAVNYFPSCLYSTKHNLERLFADHLQARKDLNHVIKTFYTFLSTLFKVSLKGLYDADTKAFHATCTPCTCSLTECDAPSAYLTLQKLVGWRGHCGSLLGCEAHCDLWTHASTGVTWQHTGRN